MIPSENIRDWRGQDVVDKDGNKIGQLVDVYVDTASDEPLFAVVRIGMVGHHRLTFTPLTGATVGPRFVRVRFSKQMVHDAPTLGMDGELPAEQEPAIFDYYGLQYTQGASGERRLARR